MAIKNFEKLHLEEIVEVFSSEHVFKVEIHDVEIPAEAQRLYNLLLSQPGLSNNLKKLMLYDSQVEWLCDGLFNRLESIINEVINFNKNYLPEKRARVLSTDIIPSLYKLRKEICNRIDECHFYINRFIEVCPWWEAKVKIRRKLNERELLQRKAIDELLKLPGNDLLGFETKPIIQEADSRLQQNILIDSTKFPFTTTNEIKGLYLMLFIAWQDGLTEVLNNTLADEFKYKLPLVDLQNSPIPEKSFEVQVNKSLRQSLVQALSKDVHKEDVQLLADFFERKQFTRNIRYANKRTVLYFLFQKLRENGNIDPENNIHNATVIKQWFKVSETNNGIYQELDLKRLQEALTRKAKRSKNKFYLYQHIHAAFEPKLGLDN